jgi:peptidoglycan hydrolase-like protein with peptidoglycan-binding domain
MTTQILGSVGAGGRNFPKDVENIQRMLTTRGYQLGRADSICGRRTIGAIRQFQSGFLSEPDGLIEVHGKSWKRLSGQHVVISKPAPKQPVKPGAPPAAKPAAPAKRVAAGGLAELIALPSKSTMNVGLSAVSNAYMIQKLGQPRPEGGYTQAGGPVTNPKLKKAMATMDVGPFKATGLRPAVSSLAAVFADVKRLHPDVYSALSTGGMLNCRLQRNSKTAISNHSWGTAIDLGLAGHGVDPRGDNKVYFGLAAIAHVFNDHGWYWGASFRTEDAMHFEASKRLIDTWAAVLV